MKVNVRMSVISQLSDIQFWAECKEEEQVRNLANYCKAVLIKYDNLDEYVESEELDNLYREVVERFKKY